MPRRLTPERQELRMYALDMHKAGWSQHEISRALGVPQPTINNWLIMNNSISDDNDSQCIVNHSAKRIIIHNNRQPITLFPCKYEDVGDGIAPESIDLILTDPPYLISSEDLSRSWQNTPLRRDYGKWDRIPMRRYIQNVGTWAKLMAQHLKQGGALYLFIDLRRSHLWYQALEAAGLTFQNFIIWHRTNPAPQLRQTKWCHAFDNILYFTKGSPKTFRWLGLKHMQNVITGPICQGAERTFHPTQKPRWLLRRLLIVSSRDGDTILDPFAGSGSTAFSGYHLDHRKYILVESDPQYVGIIRGRAKEEFDWEVIVRG